MYRRWLGPVYGAECVIERAAQRRNRLRTAEGIHCATPEGIGKELAALAVLGRIRADPIIPSNSAQIRVVLRDEHRRAGIPGEVPNAHIGQRGRAGRAPSGSDTTRRDIRLEFRGTGKAPDNRMGEVVTVVVGHRGERQRRAVQLSPQT